MTSNTVAQILFSDNVWAVFIKIIIFIVSGILVFLRMETNGIEVEKSDSKKKARTKDFFGKIYSQVPSLKNYVWIYKDKDFILWRFFSTLVYALICYKSTNLLFLFIWAYIICLISSFYFKDVYHFERKVFFHYIMSDYSYARVSRDLFISGFLIIGDNLLIIIFISCFFSPVNIILLLGSIFVIGFMTIFLNSQLFVRYPVKKNYLHFIVILIKFHIPIFNIFFLMKDVKIGMVNWENMNYE